MVNVAPEPLPLATLRALAGRYRERFRAHVARAAARAAQRATRLGARAADGDAP
jgi:hypothetical protein